MKRFYLSETLPDKSIKNMKLPPDIKQKMNAYQDAKREIENVTPQIRPQPLEKYDVNKEKRIIETDPAETDDDDKDSNKLDKLSSKADLAALPGYIRARAKRLLPYLSRVNIGDLNISNLLYDLTSASKKIRSHNASLLESVIRQLDSDALIPKRLYRNKILMNNKEKEPSSTAHPTDRGQAKRARYSVPVLGKRRYFNANKNWA